MKKVFLWLLFLLVSSIFSCKKMDGTYEQYIEKGGRTYTGRPSNVIVSGGENRIKISWLKGSDPSIVKARVFWNLGSDSIEVPILADLDTVSCIIDHLPENSYSFIIRTYDNEGNSSVPLEVFGSTYGEKYQARLLDRPVISSEQKSNGDMFVVWGEADTLSGAFATEVKYVTAEGDTATRRVDALSDTTFFYDYKSETKYLFRTLFLPDENAIDTFYTVYNQQEVINYIPPAILDISSRYLKNYSVPFEYATYDGARWGTLKDWIANDVMRNQGPAGNKIYGGYDNINSSGSFGLQKWGAGDPAIENGKIYQTFELPAGEYEFKWTTEGNSAAVNRGTGARYLVVAASNSLPDVADLASALGYTSFVTSVDRFNVSVKFTLTEPTVISVGILVNFTSGNQAFRAGSLNLWGPDIE